MSYAAKPSPSCARRRASTWRSGSRSNISLPAAIAAVPGRIRLTPQQRGIARSMGDPDVPRVTVLKSARTGYSTLLGGYIAYRAACAPGALLAVLPAESDARTFVASLIEPILDSSPAVRGVLDRDLTGRDNMTFRAFPGGSLRVVSAGAPRNLRAVFADTVIFDEADAFPVELRRRGRPGEARRAAGLHRDPAEADPGQYAR